MIGYKRYKNNEKDSYIVISSEKIDVYIYMK